MASPPLPPPPCFARGINYLNLLMPLVALRVAGCLSLHRPQCARVRCEALDMLYVSFDASACLWAKKEMRFAERERGRY